MTAGMNGKTKLIFLLLTITRWIQQSKSDSKGWSSGMLEYGSGIETIDLCFEGLDGVTCNLSVTATADCLMNIKLGSISCPITQDSASSTTTSALCVNPTTTVEHTITKHTETGTTVTECRFTQDSASPTTTTAALCMNQTFAVEKLKTITIQRTQTVNNPTTVTICPTPSPSLGSRLLRSSCGVCTPSTVTATIYQQPPIVLSDVVEVSILITSGVLICLPILTIVIVVYCWVKTRQTIKKKRQDPEMKFVYLAQDSFPKSPSTHINDNTVTAKEIDTPLYTHKDTTAAIPAEKLKSITETEPNTVTTKEIDTPLCTHEDKTATPAETLKPITVTEPKAPRQPSNGPIYATPWNLKKKESKNDKTGASQEKSGGGVAMGVASQDKSKVELELKKGVKENFYVVVKENERKTSASKGKVCEHQYDEPIIAAKGKKNEGRVSATKQKVCEHEYDKPVVAAKPKKLQSKKGKGVDSDKKDEHQYYVLEGPVPKDANNSKKLDKQEGKEDHQYHVLEGPVGREGCDSNKPDKQEGGNVYHVLEGPTPREESNKPEGNVYHVLEGPTPREGNSNKRSDKQEAGNVYHVLEGPTSRDDSNDKNQDKLKENVYHVLEGPAPRDENNDKNPDKQKMDNIYHVLEGPTPVEYES